MKKILFVLFFFLNTIILGQNNKAIVKTIKQINNISKEAYIFPKILVPNNKVATKKINNALLEFLEIENGDYKKSIFENVWYPKGDNVAWIYSDLDFKILENNSKILAINVWARFGKHNTENTEYYLFDVSTGNRITIDTLILDSKKKALAKLLYHKKDSIISTYLVSVKDSLELHTKLGDSVNIDRDLYQLEAYDRCIGRYDENDVNLEYIHFHYEKNKIHFRLEQCFPWAANCYDDLGDYHFVFTLNELKSYLSQYANKLFYTHL